MPQAGDNARALSRVSPIASLWLSRLVQLSPRMLAFLQSALRLAPTTGKALAVVLLVLNIGSWPLMWHFRVFSAVVEAHFSMRMLKLRHLLLLSSKDKKKRAVQAWYEKRMPIGVHPFRTVWSYGDWVGLDDSDYNLHMSNSSYGKTFDRARLRLALATFPTLFRCGGWAALAATHYHFLREIPMLTGYEVRASIGAWDEKWIWVIARFVKPPSKKSKSKQSSASASSSTDDSTSNSTTGTGKPAISQTLLPSLKTPATPLASGVSTPLPNTTSAHAGDVNGSAEPDTVARALMARATQREEEDGATLYTVVVSQLCFKHGRITVPPAVVLATNGFYASPEVTETVRMPLNGSATGTAPLNGLAPSTGSTSSPSNSNGKSAREAPPHWDTLSALSASMPALAKFYRGGWRELPPAERFWEHAFAASEDERRTRLVPFVGDSNLSAKGGLSGGLEGVRGLP
ncbi:hypothetical protein C8R43DRAFT_1021381 [Mycena crocata]|nr:hypothetical protein C8R43DRAFT_1021381 [Mycena crocata]